MEETTNDYKGKTTSNTPSEPHKLSVYPHYIYSSYMLEAKYSKAGGRIKKRKEERSVKRKEKKRKEVDRQKRRTGRSEK